MIRPHTASASTGTATPATGTTSATVPDIAVGNVPYTGRNPHKYLNAEFNRLQAKAGDEPWRALRSGETIEVKRGARAVAVGVRDDFAPLMSTVTLPLVAPGSPAAISSPGNPP